MQRYEAIEQGIARRDIRALREAIGTICYLNRDFSSGEFDEAVRYVESKGIQLKDDGLIGELPVSSQKSSFTEDDFGAAVFELKENFCNERIEDVKKIGKALYSVKEQAKLETRRQMGQTKHGTDPNAESHQTNNALLMAGLVAATMIILLLLAMR